jgi:excisionase family DNA binding protein
VTISTAPPDQAASPALLDVQQVADLLNCSTRHVYRLADAGRMPQPVRLGALVRWPRQGIEDWIASGCKPVRQAGRA